MVDTAYMTDMWENCVDVKQENDITRSKFSYALDMMEEFGYLKKHGYTK